jgi:[protein-PII] uridylyltransferase
VEQQLAQFPLRYVFGTPAARVAAHLTAIHSLNPGAVLVHEAFQEALGTCEFTVITFNDLTPGIFSKIAGVLASLGLQILDAQIITRPDGVVVDTFQVVDRDFAGVPPVERRVSIARSIERILKGEETVESLLRRSHRIPEVSPALAGRQPTEVQVDNETSDRYTIIDVFADDRQGLLYVITRAMFRLGLSVHAARISTRLDQVADVFYVTHQQGGKLEDRTRLEAIRHTIQEEIDQFLGGKLGEGVGEDKGVSSYLL